MIKLISIFLLSAVLHVQIAKAGTQSSIADQLSRYIMSQQQEQLLFLEKLVEINSGTTNIAGVHRVGEMLRPQFEQLGFNTRWIDEPVKLRRAGTLVAERLGHHGKRLLLIGHLDTVFPPNSPFQHFERHGNFIKGPGVLDDKGGDVVILYALKALQAVHALNDATITVMLMGDEEDSGKPTSISRKPLIEAARHSDIALDFECAITKDTATIARRGVSTWEIKAQGNEAHSSGIFQKQAGDGAIYELVRILNKMRETLAGEQYLSFNPGLIIGGTGIQYDAGNTQGAVIGKRNVIAKMAIATGDLRFMSAEQKIHAEKEIIAIVSQHLPGTTAIVNFQEGMPSMPPTAANLALLKKYSEASNDLGYGFVKPFNSGLRGAGDISHIASLVYANLAGLGPVGSGAHSVEETLDVDSLPMQTERAALFIYRLIF